MTGVAIPLLAKHPADRAALVDWEGAEVRYSQLASSIESLAGQLTDAGLGREDRVGLLVPSGISGAHLVVALAVLALVTDPTAFPRWASGLARAVRGDGPDWLVETDEGEVRLRVRISPEHGTVDYLVAAALPDTEIGAFSRVVPNGRGCDYIFTRFFTDGISATELAEERAVVAVELQTVRALCERADLRAAA